VRLITENSLGRELFVWFDYIRPTSPMDVFVWRGKIEGTEIKKKARKEVPLQKLE
jgi:hypothetical protein